MLVAGEDLGRADVLSGLVGLFQDVGQCGDVAEACVEALTGDGVHSVGSVTDKSDAIRDERVGEGEVEGIAEPLTLKHDVAEEAAEGGFERFEESVVVHGHAFFGAGVGFAPDNRGAVAVERQDRERAVGHEELVGDAAVGLFVGDSADNGSLAVGPAGALDACAGGGAGLSAVAADNE